SGVLTIATRSSCENAPFSLYPLIESTLSLDTLSNPCWEEVEWARRLSIQAVTDIPRESGISIGRSDIPNNRTTTERNKFLMILRAIWTSEPKRTCDFSEAG